MADKSPDAKHRPQRRSMLAGSWWRAPAGERNGRHLKALEKTGHAAAIAGGWRLSGFS